MKNRRNYYRILHVGRDAPAAVIQASYRTLMQRLRMHPDLGGDHAQAALINEAYATLGDPGRRAAYDRTLARASEQRREARREPPAGTSRPEPAPAPPPPAAPATAPCPFCRALFPAIQADCPDLLCATCSSPLAPPPRQPAEEASRRAAERVNRHMPVTFRLARSRDLSWSGTSEDVSVTGMRLLADLRVPIGERLQIDCRFCLAVAVVRSARPHDGPGPGRWQYGVEFVTFHLKQARGGLFSTVA